MAIALLLLFVGGFCLFIAGCLATNKLCDAADRVTEAVARRSQ